MRYWGPIFSIVLCLYKSGLITFLSVHSSSTYFWNFRIFSRLGFSSLLLLTTLACHSEILSWTDWFDVVAGVHIKIRCCMSFICHWNTTVQNLSCHYTLGSFNKERTHILLYPKTEFRKWFLHGVMTEDWLILLADMPCPLGVRVWYNMKMCYIYYFQCLPTPVYIYIPTKSRKFSKRGDRHTRPQPYRIGTAASTLLGIQEVTGDAL